MHEFFERQQYQWKSCKGTERKQVRKAIKRETVHRSNEIDGVKSGKLENIKNSRRKMKIKIKADLMALHSGKKMWQNERQRKNEMQKEEKYPKQKQQIEKKSDKNKGARATALFHVTYSWFGCKRWICTYFVIFFLCLGSSQHFAQLCPHNDTFFALRVLFKCSFLRIFFTLGWNLLMLFPHSRRLEVDAKKVRVNQMQLLKLKMIFTRTQNQ